MNIVLKKQLYEVNERFFSGPSQEINEYFSFNKILEKEPYNTCWHVITIGNEYINQQHQIWNQIRSQVKKQLEQQPEQ